MLLFSSNMYDKEVEISETLKRMRQNNPPKQELEFNQTQISTLNQLNDKLIDVEKTIAKEIKTHIGSFLQKYEQNKDGRDGFYSSEDHKVTIQFYLAFDDPDYDEDDEVIIEIKAWFDIDLWEWGINDGKNHNEFEHWKEHPLFGQHHCWILHSLYDDTHLTWEEILRIAHVDFKINLKIDYANNEYNEQYYAHHWPQKEDNNEDKEKTDNEEEEYEEIDIDYDLHGVSWLSTHITAKETGLPTMICVCIEAIETEEKTLGPRLVVANEVKRQEGNTFFSLSISKEPKIVFGTCKISDEELQQIKDFILKHKVTLLEHWYQENDSITIVEKFCPHLVKDRKNTIQ